MALDLVLRLKIKAKLDLNSWVDISQTTAAMPSKFCVVVWLKLSNIFIKSGVWITGGSKMPKVKIKSKFDLNSGADISWTVTPRTSTVQKCSKLEK